MQCNIENQAGLQAIYPPEWGGPIIDWATGHGEPVRIESRLIEISMTAGGRLRVEHFGDCAEASVSLPRRPLSDPICREAICVFVRRVAEQSRGLEWAFDEETPVTLVKRLNADLDGIGSALDDLEAIYAMTTSEIKALAADRRLAKLFMKPYGQSEGR